MLHEVKTEHQHLVIFENPTWGTVLMLDGVCQLTTSDEFVYHEMMAHVPLMALARPKRVLVIGGGDGGVLREVLKHPSVAKATLCEIDRAVDRSLAASTTRRSPAAAFDDARADVVIADGLKYVAETRERFDAIIVDSSEPIGPSAVLHTREFFTDCKRALKKGGILVTQNGLPFLFPEHLQGTTAVFASLFKRVAALHVHAALLLRRSVCAQSGDRRQACGQGRCQTACQAPEEAGHAGLKYWTPEVHIGAFALPAYVRQVVDRTAIDEARAKGKGAKAYVAARRRRSAEPSPEADRG